MGRYGRKDCCYDRVVVVPGGSAARSGTVIPYSATFTDVSLLGADSYFSLGFGSANLGVAIPVPPLGTIPRDGAIAFPAPSSGRASNLSFEFQNGLTLAPGQSITMRATLFKAAPLPAAANLAADTPAFVRTPLTAEFTFDSILNAGGAMIAVDKTNSVVINEGDSLALVIEVEVTGVVSLITGRIDASIKLI